VLADEPAESSIEDIGEALRYRDSHTYGKHVVPRLACRAMLQKGVRGVNELVALLPHAPGSIYPTTIEEALWYASRCELSPDGLVQFVGIDPESIPQSLQRQLSEPVARAAREALQDLVVQASTHPDLFRTVFGFFFNQIVLPIKSEPAYEAEVRSDLLRMLSESTIRITRQVIARFEKLVEGKHREEDYKQFLTENPVLIDPLAAEVIPKQRLGIEYITDFVVRRHDRRYILVEIEKPHDRIFTEGGDFSSRFTHAIGQVLDFQQWVDSNKSYAEKLLPNISSPRGLLIMGRRTEMSSKDEEKLHRFCVNSAAIDVLTYDDVIAQSTHLYESIHRY
jgi:hypothetical protein